jgi:hypothetical protein
VSRIILAAAATALLLHAEEEAVFRSDINLVRVDVQVLDSRQRAITGLEAEDFLLREEGKPRRIRNFVRDEMPLDVLFLVDVSGSMRPHVERMASAAHQALPLLGDGDRAAIMVFDRSTRTRMPYRNVRQGVERDFDNLLRVESFDGGTDITRALHAAASYVRKEARPEARRAIVLLTDDQTEFGRDELGVGTDLARADAVLSVLLVPDAMRRGRIGRPRGTWPGGGGTWPGGGGGGWGGVIIPPPGRFPGPVQTGGGTQSAGSAEIARASGGEAIPADTAGALESTITRLRQRYALHFLLPPGVKEGEKRTIHVALASAVRRRHPGADVRFRSMYAATVTTPPSETDAEIIDVPAEALTGPPSSQRDGATDASTPARRRRPAMDSSAPRGPLTIEDR